MPWRERVILRCLWILLSGAMRRCRRWNRRREDRWPLIRLSGRRLELEALNGTMVRLGEEHGLSLPFNFAIYGALKPYANGALR
jgi:hypothetical protein